MLIIRPMKSLAIILFCILFYGCSKDSQNNNECAFLIGKWCIWDDINNSCAIGDNDYEFRSSGELLILGASFKWESTDCKRINVISNVSGQKFYELNIIEKVSNTIIKVEQSGSVDTWHKI